MLSIVCEGSDGSDGEVSEAESEEAAGSRGGAAMSLIVLDELLSKARHELHIWRSRVRAGRMVRRDRGAESSSLAEAVWSLRRETLRSLLDFFVPLLEAMAFFPWASLDKGCSSHDSLPDIDSRRLRDSATYSSCCGEARERVTNRSVRAGRQLRRTSSFVRRISSGAISFLSSAYAASA